MARFLFTVWPFVGHVYNQVAIAQALRARGHEVAFYTGRDMEPVLRGEGFAVFPFRHIDAAKLRESILPQEQASSAGWWTPGLWLRIARDWLYGTVPDQVADLEPIIDSWGPDVLVTDVTMWAPILVLWESTGIPTAVSSTMMGCPFPGPDVRPWIPWMPRTLANGLKRATDFAAALAGSPGRRRIDALRAARGLPSMGYSAEAFAMRLPLYLVPSIPALDFKRRDLPASVQYTGDCSWNKPSKEPPAGWLDSLPPDRLVVHVSEGTAHHQEPFLLRAAAAGLGGAPVEVVMTTGSNRHPGELGLAPLAPNVRVVRWVSHQELLPRCAAVVTTGGAGTILAALRQGLPLVVVPTHWDKSDNARRVVEAGAGLRLDAARCNPRTLRAAVLRVLHDESFRHQAERMSRLLGDAVGPPGAAALLESLIRRPRALTQTA
ncbi:MAG TPA: glycosyltransferase [Chloroflexota bacterium]|nr:glycosyltransferase [Chloroflexota bacterium]